MGAVLKEVMWLPVPKDVEKVTKQLTVTFSPLQGQPVVIKDYSLQEGLIAVPRVWGVNYCRSLGIRYEDRRGYGTNVVFSSKISLREEQVPFVESIYQEAAAGSVGFVAKAATGKGKTVCALEVIARLGRTACIVVDQDNLFDQWIREIGKFLGVPQNKVGRVKAKDFVYKDKKITVAMVQSLVRKSLPDAFVDYFGVVVFDEVHVTGAPVYSQVLRSFNARVRFGLSATPQRYDSLNKIIHWHLGQVGPMLLDQHKKSAVYILKNYTVYSWYANKAKTTGRYLHEVSTDGARNLRIAQAIRWLYDRGHNVLALSDRIEQLWGLQHLCYFLGVPFEETGLYTGYAPRWGYGKDPTPKVPGYWEKGTLFTPIQYGVVRTKQPKRERDRIKATARVVFATYGTFSKGVDEPRLSAGIDCTPKSEIEQIHGRVLRKMVGKLVPVWVTIRDVNSYRAEFQLSRRITGYLKSNAEIYEWEPDLGIKKIDASLLQSELNARSQELRQCRIVARLDGNNTLLTPTTQIAYASP